MARDRGCAYPGCIRSAVEMCPKCFEWFCATHKGQGHNCEEIDAWVKATPFLNELSPTEILHGVEKDMPGPEKPSRKDWCDAIER